MSLRKIIEREGRFPPVELRIKPLGGGSVVRLRHFLGYSFDSSILVPVDSYSFKFVAPDDKLIALDYFQEGDIVQLFGNEELLATGILDHIEIEVDQEFGETVTVVGRDLMGQMEDQDAISLDSAPIFATKATLSTVFERLKKDTRLQRLRLQDAPTKAYLFATEPGESKLSALSRYMEPLNVLSWMDPDGTLVIGRPNMAQGTLGTLILDRKRRLSNVLSMKAVFAAATIPNIIVPIWVGQEMVQSRVSKEQVLLNTARGPARLLGLGHRLPKSIVVSNPEGGSAQDLAEINRIQAGGGNLLQAYAKRDCARQNIKELSVQCTLPGHFNELGNPFKVDTCYQVVFDRARLDEKMYLYHVSYSLELQSGQKTNLFFTRLGTIVSDIKAR